MKNAQYLAEIVILISIVIAAIVGMQTYVRRSIQANMKKGVDAGVELAHQNITDLHLPGDTSIVTSVQPRVVQYEPYYDNENSAYGVRHTSRENNRFAAATVTDPGAPVAPVLPGCKVTACPGAWLAFMNNYDSYLLKLLAYNTQKSLGFYSGKGKLKQDSYYSSNVTSQSKSYFDTSSNVVWQK